jgi:hypothetical protein
LSWRRQIADTVAFRKGLNGLKSGIRRGGERLDLGKQFADIGHLFAHQGNAASLG